MAFENTLTENDLDAGTQQFVQRLHNEIGDIEPDLAVDGLSESMLSKLLGLFRTGR